ncbi:MAG TPA: sigma-70 family RNA polymerase sigma factor [bacterium]|nr:sigma-70 family RNA polymerase sigma factor [bacterium]
MGREQIANVRRSERAARGERPRINQERDPAGRRGAADAPVSPAAQAPAGSGTDDNVLALFQTYRRTQDRVLQQSLVLRFLPLVHRIARRYVRPGAPLEDLVQIGSIGLIHAVTTFDPTRGVKFETYAFHHVAGEIRHFLRDGLEAVRAPRWVRKIYADMTVAVDKLQQDLGRTPTVPEIALAMNMTEDGVREVLDAHSQIRVRSMTDMTEEHDVRPDMIAHQRYVSLQLPIEDRIVLMEAMERLADLQRQVVYYLFYQDLTQSEVAKRLGVSQRHVSRLLAAALRHLAEPLRAAGMGSPAAS